MTGRHVSSPSAETADFEPFRRQAQALLFGSMPEHVSRLGWARARIEAFQRDQLRELLAHAIRRSPFHARRLAAVDPATFELEDLSRLPVMTKAEMMASFDDVVTDRRVTRAAVERAIEATTTTPVPIDGQFTVLTSGGASGLRGVFVFDPPAMATFGATLLRPLISRLQAGGGPPPGDLRIAFVAAASPIHATGCAPRILDGSAVSFVSIPVTLSLGEIVARLNELQPPLLFGYPTMLARLANERRAGRLTIAPRSVTATSETLRPELREAIAGGFGVPVIDTFGSSEGLAGSSPPDDAAITFASDHCIVELVDERDRPVPMGTSSASILVTNLYNHVQPLIRYRIEDRFRRIPDNPDHGHLRAKVDGRSSDILHFDGVDVHPHAVSTWLTHTTAIVDFQVRQTPRGVDIDVVAPAGVDGTRVADDVRRGLVQAGVADPAVRVAIVDMLPRDPKSGKLATFVPWMPQRKRA